MAILRAFLRDRSAMAGAILILLMVVLAFFSRALAPYPDDAFETHLLLRLRAPGLEHLFGTDVFGRDVFSRVLMGTGNALAISSSVVAIAAAVGVPLGLFAGYFEGRAGDLLMRLTDIFLSVPSLVLAIALAQLLRPGLGSAVIALSITYWPHFCRSAYAEARALRSATFIEALESLGVGRLHIMFMHVLPNTASPIIVRATLGMGYIILTAAVLGFLGIGIPPPEPDWGASIAEGRQYLPRSWWLVGFPGLAIFLSVLGFNLLGDGLRDVIDPRLRKSR